MISTRVDPVSAGHPFGWRTAPFHAFHRRGWGVAPQLGKQFLLRAERQAAVPGTSHVEASWRASPAAPADPLPSEAAGLRVFTFASHV